MTTINGTTTVKVNPQGAVLTSVTCEPEALGVPVPDWTSSKVEVGLDAVVITVVPASAAFILE
jgi:hypothetical protein